MRDMGVHSVLKQHPRESGRTGIFPWVPETLAGEGLVKGFSGQVLTGPEDGLEGTSRRPSRKEKLRCPISPAPGDPYSSKSTSHGPLPSTTSTPCSLESLLLHPTPPPRPWPGQLRKLAPGNFL